MSARTCRSAWGAGGLLVRLAVVGLAVASLTPEPAAAQAAASPAPKRDPAAAEALFKKALALSDRGKKKEACPIFDESYLLDPAPGTLLNIAECHRVEGKTATAWGEFIEAAREFRRRNDERRAGFADGEADKLKPLLAYVTFSMADPPEGLTWTRDGVTSSKGSLGERLPIDPGAHSVEVSAPGFKPATVGFEAVAKKLVDVPLPALELAPPEEKPAAPADAGQGDTQLIAGFVVGGVGIAAGVVGLAMVGLTASAADDLETACPTKVGCDQALYDDALLYSNLANVFLIVGGVAFATGLVVVLTAPSDDAATSDDALQGEAAAAVWLAPSLGGVLLQGEF